MNYIIFDSDAGSTLFVFILGLLITVKIIINKEETVCTRRKYNASLFAINSSYFKHNYYTERYFNYILSRRCGIKY